MTIPFMRYEMPCANTFAIFFWAKPSRDTDSVMELSATKNTRAVTRSKRGMFSNFLIRCSFTSARSDECVQFVSRTAMPDFFTSFSRESEMAPPIEPVVADVEKEIEVSSWNKAAQYLVTHRECLEIAAIRSLDRVLRHRDPVRTDELCRDLSSMSAAL